MTQSDIATLNQQKLKPKSYSPYLEVKRNKTFFRRRNGFLLWLFPRRYFGSSVTISLIPSFSLGQQRIHRCQLPTSQKQTILHPNIDHLSSYRCCHRPGTNHLTTLLFNHNSKLKHMHVYRFLWFVCICVYGNNI